MSLFGDDFGQGIGEQMDFGGDSPQDAVPEEAAVARKAPAPLVRGLGAGNGGFGKGLMSLPRPGTPPILAGGPQAVNAPPPFYGSMQRAYGDATVGDVTMIVPKAPVFKPVPKYNLNYGMADDNLSEACERQLLIKETYETELHDIAMHNAKRIFNEQQRVATAALELSCQKGRLVAQQQVDKIMADYTAEEQKKLSEHKAEMHAALVQKQLEWAKVHMVFQQRHPTVATKPLSGFPVVHANATAVDPISIHHTIRTVKRFSDAEKVAMDCLENGLAHKGLPVKRAAAAPVPGFAPGLVPAQKKQRQRTAAPAAESPGVTLSNMQSLVKMVGVPAAAPVYTPLVREEGMCNKEYARLEYNNKRRHGNAMNRFNGIPAPPRKPRVPKVSAADAAPVHLITMDVDDDEVSV
jgi:predicted protein tyrosine phosphatase